METQEVKSWDAFLDAYIELQNIVNEQDKLLSKMIRLKQNERFVKDYKEIPRGENFGDRIA